MHGTGPRGRQSVVTGAAGTALASAAVAAVGSTVLYVAGMRNAPSAWAGPVASGTMWLTTVALAAFVVAQLNPRGWEPVRLGRLVRDAWLSMLALALGPVGAWRDLAGLSPVPLGLDWLPGWPLNMTVLFVFARVIQLWGHVLGITRPERTARAD